jgi:hypothetical protein
LKAAVDALIRMMLERRLLFTKIQSGNILDGRLLPYE